jgi:hypothetical protein
MSSTLDTTHIPPTSDMAITGRPDPRGSGLVALDLYRDIHKGIRSELFAVCIEAGRLDPADHAGRLALAAQVRSVVALLVSHADHEDTHVQAAIETHLPNLAKLIEGDHHLLEERMEVLVEMADSAAAAPRDEQRSRLHHLYLELCSFSGAYLQHQEVEERIVMPALEIAIGVPAVIDIHHAIIGSIPAEEMARSLALMLPVMNIDERTEMLGGMRDGAPPEVFAGVWSLTGSVLTSADRTELARRLDLA